MEPMVISRHPVEGRCCYARTLGAHSGTRTCTRTYINKPTPTTHTHTHTHTCETTSSSDALKRRSNTLWPFPLMSFGNSFACQVHWHISSSRSLSLSSPSVSISLRVSIIPPSLSISICACSFCVCLPCVSLSVQRFEENAVEASAFKCISMLHTFTMPCHGLHLSHGPRLVPGLEMRNNKNNNNNNNNNNDYKNNNNS
jgi:hypothetical protein